MDPVRKLYIDKCNENIDLRREIQLLKNQRDQGLATNLEGMERNKPARARQELFDSMCFLEQSLDFTSTTNSRNHNSHLLQRIQEIEKLKNQCDILIQDIKCKNDMIIKQQDEIKSLKEEVGFRYCPQCGQRRNKSKSPGKRQKSLEQRLPGIEVKVSLSNKKMNKKQRKLDEIVCKSELV